MKTIIRIIRQISFMKTLVFNFKYFSFKEAIRLPIFIYKHTLFYKTKGNIKIKDVPIRTGMIKIGCHNLGTRDIKLERTIIEISGNVIFHGKCNIGSGSHISVGSNGILTIGNNFSITGNSSIICVKSISFGNDCLISWDNLIMDTDFHKIYNSKGERINDDKSIVIGNHVWIGCRNTILKGVTVGDGNIVAANSTITKGASLQNCIIGDNNVILKENIFWEP